MTPQELLLEVFRLVDDQLQALNLGRLRQRGPQPKLADSEVITIERRSAGGAVWDQADVGEGLVAAVPPGDPQGAQPHGPGPDQRPRRPFAHATGRPRRVKLAHGVSQGRKPLDRRPTPIC